ncbi:MAG TPA: hypothetical protein VF678_06745 [bacterium]
MKMIRELPHRVFSNLRSRLKVVPAREVPDATQVGKGHNLLRLHEYQHRVIVDIFKTSIAGFFAFSLILLSFSLHTLLDPQAPAWLGYVMGLMSIMLLAGLYRTLREFRAYRHNYEEITEQLRAKVMQSTRATAPSAKPKAGIEQRLLSSLKPKEHKGWDAKSCRGCGRAIELMASVCPSCGQEQGDLLSN